MSNALVRRSIEDGRLSGEHLTLMAVSGVLAVIAFLADSIPLLLGAMIVAPAFPPLARTVMAVAAGAWRHALRGLGTSVLGLAVASVAALLALWLVAAAELIEDPRALLSRPLLEERVRPGWYSLIAAVAAGIAGTLGFIRNRTDTLIGTVASVALVPAATAAAGALFVGDGQRAIGGLVLLASNVGLIVAMGLLTIALRPAVGPNVTRPAADPA